ncbi:MAG: ABC transporter substrate-binding protein [Janthinobacterium lividum]
MHRRTLLQATAATAVATTVAASLPRPAIAQSATRLLRFIPEGNLANPDPIWTTTTVARNHGFMIYDTLYGLDQSLSPKPQMAEAHELSDDRLTWRFRLRDGLKFHDGTPVRGVDCVASLARWMKRDGMGQRIATQLAGMAALDDRSFEITLSKPFPLMLTALGKPSANVAFIMPERVAQTDAFTQITDFTGSGPYRFIKDEWTPGALASYSRFGAYSPRGEAPSFVSGGKQAHFDRIEWKIIPDSATSAAAMQAGEADWWQSPIVDLLPQLKAARGVKVQTVDTIGNIEVIRFNHLQPPFNNPKLRQAVMMVVDQKEFMQAAFGDDPGLWKTGVGIFTPGSPAATEVGMAALNGKRDWDGAKKLVAESGYKGEKAVIIAPTDYPWLQAFCQVTRELLVKLGINVEYVSTDWGTVVQRRASKNPVDQGGWSIFCTGWEGLNLNDPAGHYPVMGNGAAAWFGWPESPRIEALRTAWYDAPDAAAQKSATDAIQLAAFEEVPYIPLGQFFQPIAVRDTVSGVLASPFPIFWNVKKG